MLAVACIGKRDALEPWLDKHLEAVGEFYARRGYIVVSGNAIGADQAYARGANRVAPQLVELFLPWASYEQQAIHPENSVRTADQALPIHIEMAQAAAPAWDSMRQSVRRLMIRNAMVIYRWGDPVSLVCAEPSYHKPGWSGTGHGIRIATTLGIPVHLISRGCLWNPNEGMTK